MSEDWRATISWLIYIALLVLLAILAGYVLQELKKPMALEGSQRASLTPTSRFILTGIGRNRETIAGMPKGR